MTLYMPYFIRRAGSVCAALFLLIVILSVIAVATGRNVAGYDFFESGERSIPPEMVKAAATQWPGSRLIRVTGSEIEARIDSGLIGLIVETFPYSSHVVGYGGPVPMAIFLNPDHTVLKVILLKHDEDEEFMFDVESAGVFKAWSGLPAPTAVSKKVDAVTGATKSSIAVIRSVQETLQVIAAKDGFIRPPTADIRADIQKTGWKEVAGLSILILGIAFGFLYRGQRVWRTIFLGGNVIVLGFLNGSCLSLSWLVSRMACGTLAGAGMIAIGMFLTLILMPVLTRKPFYCIWICPFGALQELAGRTISRKVTIPQRAMSLLKYSRQVLLGGFILLWAFGMGRFLLGYEPFSVFLPLSAADAVLIFACAIVVMSFFINRPWCRFGCPAGLVIRWLERGLRGSSDNVVKKKANILEKDDES